MMLRYQTDQHGNEHIHLTMSDADLRDVQLNPIERRVVEHANRALISDRLIILAMMAKSIEKADFKRQREQS